MVLITGAAGGIGRAVAGAAIAAGARVLGVDRLEMRPEILPEHDLFTIDVGDWDAWREIEQEISSRFGHLDGLVSAAAVMHPRDGDILDLDQEAWQDTLRSNLTGTLLASQAAVRLMGESGGSIVHLASTVAHLGSAEPQLAYTASKGAFSRSRGSSLLPTRCRGSASTWSPPASSPPR